MNDTDTNVTDDPDPDDLNGLAASLDHLRLWCELDRAGTRQFRRVINMQEQVKEV